MKRVTGFSLERRVVRSSVGWDGAGIELAGYLAMRFTYRTREQWAEVISGGFITVNGVPGDPRRPLLIYDFIEYRPDDIVEPPAALEYRMAFEDEHLMVVDKPGNLCVHPAGPFFKHTLWHLLVSRFGRDVHFVNRLDRETSGLLIVAKTPEIAARLAKLEIAKTYRAVVHGDFPGRLAADGVLFRDLSSGIRKKRRYAACAPDGAVGVETASTEFAKLESANGYSMVEAVLHTGRMHQIRATLSSLGYPIVGDKLYGLDERFYLKLKDDALDDADRARLVLDRQALHSWRTEFRHPVTGASVAVESPVPADMSGLLEKPPEPR